MSPSRREPRRRLRLGRLLVVAVLAAAVVLAAYFMTCGHGFGLGAGGGLGLGGTGSGKGAGEATKAPAVRPAVGAQPGAPAPIPHCRLRLDAAGLHVTPATAVASVDDAIAACRASGTAELTVTGDAAYGALQETRGRLEGAGLTVLTTGADGAPLAPDAGVP